MHNCDAADTKYQYRQLDCNVGLVFEHVLLGSITLLLKQTTNCFTVVHRQLKLPLR
jgi:hypothetical protein